MKTILKRLWSDEKGAMELSSTVLLTIGVVSIIGLMLALFSDQLINMAEGMFGSFGDDWQYDQVN